MKCKHYDKCSLKEEDDEICMNNKKAKKKCGYYEGIAL